MKTGECGGTLFSGVHSDAADSDAVIPPGEHTEPEGPACCCCCCSVLLVGEEKVGKAGKSPPSLCSEMKL